MPPKGEPVVLYDFNGNVINPATTEKLDELFGEVQDIPSEFTLLRRTKDILIGQNDGSQKTQIVDGIGNVIGSLNNSLNVHNADVHTKIISRHFKNFNGATVNPSSAISPGDILINVTNTTGFAVGNEIVIKDSSGDIREHLFIITNLVVNTSITVDKPIERSYTTSATLEIVISNMNVNGSLSTPIIFEIKPPSDEIWHLTRLLMSITDDTVGQFDDSKFGSLAPLTNGVSLRENKSNLFNIENWKNNAELIITMFDVVYSDSAPAGNEGLRGRFTFARADAIVKLDGSLDEKIEVLIQDDLTSLTGFIMKCQGHIEGQT
jgi:hypothetical protein